MAKPKLDYDEIRRVFDAAVAKSRRGRIRATAETCHCSVGTVGRALSGRKGSGSNRLGKPTGKGIDLDLEHSAIARRGTLFPTTVHLPHENVLKPGEFSAKLGMTIEGGRFKDFAIYSLSLEERATCPRSCVHWFNCYGNNMPQAKRYAHGRELERRLPLEVGALLLKHPKGVAIRLHTLGDFYSWSYVYLWRDLLEQHPGLMVFGFTARIDTVKDPIADVLARTVRAMWPRFAIRFSNGAHNRVTTASIDKPADAPQGAVVCPAQWTKSGKTASTCGSCGFCWNSTRQVAFLRH